MTRLQHNPEAFVRVVQLSQKDVFAFCEGKRLDPFFYAKLMDEALSGSGLVYEMIEINEVARSGGKMALKEIFDIFERKGKLALNKNGKTASCIFFFDKDADCVLGKNIKSKHAIYTKYYDVEAHIFRECDLSHSIAVAASLSPARVPSKYAVAPEWCEECAVRWREWIALCLYSQRYKKNKGCGYSRLSIINGDDFISGTNLEAFSKLLNSLRDAAESHEEFDSNFKDIEDIVVSLIKCNDLFKLMKGKWLSTIIESELRSELSSGDLNGVASRIVSAGLASISFSSAWAEYFLEKIRDVVGGGRLPAVSSASADANGVISAHM